MRHRVAKPSAETYDSALPRPGHCKKMFAQLSNYLDEELDDSLCSELEKHMDGCEPCEAFLASVEKSIKQCSLMPNEFPDPRVAAHLRRELMAEYQAAMSKIVSRSPSEFARR